MAGRVVNNTKNMLDSIGAVQTLVENFPMLLSFNNNEIGKFF